MWDGRKLLNLTVNVSKFIEIFSVIFLLKYIENYKIMQNMQLPTLSFVKNKQKNNNLSPWIDNNLITDNNLKKYNLIFHWQQNNLCKLKKKIITKKLHILNCTHILFFLV